MSIASTFAIKEVRTYLLDAVNFSNHLTINSETNSKGAGIGKQPSSC